MPLYVQADISNKEQGENLVDQTIKQFGQLDILINNAGWTQLIAHHNLDALTDDIFTRTFDVNVTGTWMLTKYAMPHLRKSQDGNVVNITSVAGVRAMGSSIAYAMSKAALNHMTILLAKACGPVRVNAVAPGLVETPGLRTGKTSTMASRPLPPCIGRPPPRTAWKPPWDYCAPPMQRGRFSL
jgi:ketoreductase RED2